MVRVNNVECSQLRARRSGAAEKDPAKVLCGGTQRIACGNRGEFIVSIAGGEDNNIIINGRIAREKVFS
jgi:hypothetical protein